MKKLFRVQSLIVVFLGILFLNPSSYEVFILNGSGGDPSQFVETSQSKTTYTKQEIRSYFNEICTGSEYGNAKYTYKWKHDVKIFVKGEKRDYLMDELRRIIKELNSLIDPIKLKIVNTMSEADFIILFGTHTEFKKMNPGDAKMIDKNWGYFSCGVNDKTRSIIYGEMYVDLYRTSTRTEQKHLLREELTQAMGLANDSWKYPNSIFYQGWTTTTEYDEIDREIIKMLYNN